MEYAYDELIHWGQTWRTEGTSRAHEPDFAGGSREASRGAESNFIVLLDFTDLPASSTMAIMTLNGVARPASFGRMAPVAGTELLLAFIALITSAPPRNTSLTGS